MNIVRTFTANDTWTAPPDVTEITVEARGGGGGGGALRADTNKAAGGGAGGQYAIKVVTVVPGTTYNIVVGAAGTAGSSTGPTNGGVGGDSTFNATDVVAKGGEGGQTYENGYQGGTGSTTGGVGDTVYAGGNGADGGDTNIGGGGGEGAGSTGTGGSASGATGGSGTDGGNGGNGGVNSSGVAGTAPGGAGGGGGTTATTNRPGGAGAVGRVVLTYVSSAIALSEALTPTDSFSYPKTISQAGGNWSDTATWLGGVVPVNGDDVRAMATSGNLAVNVTTANLNSFDLTGYVGTLSGYNPIEVRPVNGSTVTVRFAGTISQPSVVYLDTITSSDSATVNFYSGGKTLNQVAIGNNIAGNLTFNQQDNLTFNRNTQLTKGTWNTNNYNITETAWASSGSGTKVFNAGSSTITLTSASFGWYNYGTNFTFNCGTSTIIIPSTSSSSGDFNFYGANQIYYNLNISGGGTGAILITGSNSFNNITITKPRTIKFTAGTTQTISTSLIALGDGGNIITLKSTIDGSSYTIRKSYVDANWSVGANSTLVSGNTGLTVEADPSGYMDYCSIRDLNGELTGQKAVQDTITISDTKPKFNITLRELLETATGSENLNLSWLYYRTCSDTLVSSDQNRNIAYYKLNQDTINISDIKRMAAMGHLLSDEVTVSDAVAIRWIIFSLTLSDEVTISEADALLSWLYFRQLTDGITISDNTTKAAMKLVLNSLTLDDLVFITGVRSLTLLETISSSEEVYKDVIIHILLETITPTDLVSYVLSRYKTLTESVTISSNAQEWMKKSGKPTTWANVPDASNIWTRVR